MSGIQEYGITVEHRRSFAPVRAVMENSWQGVEDD